MLKAFKRQLINAATDSINFAIIFLIVYLIMVPLYPLLADKMPALNRTGQETSKTVRNTLPSNTDKPKMNKLTANTDKTAVKAASAPVTTLKATVTPKPVVLSTTKPAINMLVIKKIGVEAPIIVTNSERTGLSKGVWRYPTSKDPDEGGNFIISGHRYKYLPPHKVTFYSLDKMQAGDEIDVTWDGVNYVYRVREVKIVQPNERSVVEQTGDDIITLITCTPLFTTQKRLIVIGEMVK